MSLTSLLPLIRKTRSPLSPSEFHKTVNVVFHDVEAGHYDLVHEDMWQSLGRQFNLLAGDLLPFVPDRIRLLDIGCGTGLSTELLLQTGLGRHISHITLADTSTQMLERAAKRSRGWQIPTDTFNTGIESLCGSYDLILVCSVLHHIPDIEEFLSSVSRLQKTGGILMHLQDPNGDNLNDGAYRQRLSELEAAHDKPILKKVASIIPNRWKLAVKKAIGKKSYIDQVNDKLLQMKAIARPMREDEIWSVTDIHVDGLPFSTGTGISLSRMRELLPYQLIGARSYGFFGFLESELPAEFRSREQQLIQEHAVNGRYLAATWIKS